MPDSKHANRGDQVPRGSLSMIHSAMRDQRIGSFSSSGLGGVLLVNTESPIRSAPGALGWGEVPSLIIRDMFLLRGPISEKDLSEELRAKNGFWLQLFR